VAARHRSGERHESDARVLYETCGVLMRYMQRLEYAVGQTSGPEAFGKPFRTQGRLGGMLQQHGIFSSMCYTAGDNNLNKGLNNPVFHENLIKEYLETIPIMAKAGYKNLICFTGKREGMDDETGMKNCIEALKKILPSAEKNGVTMVMELLNSKIDHKDYMCDHVEWGAELCKRISSENFKLLFDIYHMQIQEGDIIRNITDYHQYIAHYHTGGVPGRNEIDETQELYYPAIMKAILDTGFKGYVAQEFIPNRKTNEEKLVSLEKAIKICDV